MSTTSYTDTNNVVYTYTVPVSGNTDTAFVDLSPDATNDITFLSTFIVDSITYTVTSIIANAFNNGSLTSVIIPSTITSIGASAFESNGITTATLYNGLLTIGSRAFYGNQLTTIIIPNTVTSISDASFQSNMLTSITIGTSITSIGVSAFQSNSLTTLFIPVSVTFIGNNSFKSNKLTKVYFFNIPTFGSGATIGSNSNAFSTNTGGAITAYYINTSTTVQINSLPNTFTLINRISITKLNILKVQIQQGVSVEYLLSDNFTLAEMISAVDAADWLLTYYSLQTLVDASFPVYNFFVSSTITLLSLFQCGISIVALKDAGADVKRMLNEFLLSDLIIAGYNVSELKTASESNVSPVVTADNKVTIQKFKLAGANVSQMLESYLLSELISNDYRVSVLYNAKTTLTLSDFVTASAPLWDLINNYALNLLIPYFTVAQFITSSNEKVSGVFRVSDTAKQELNLKAGTLKTTGANIKEMMNSFSLSDLIVAFYIVSELKTASESNVSPVVTADNKVTIQNFKLAGANVSQMLESYLLSELISNDYRVSVLYNAKTTLTLSDFVTAGAPLWDLLNHYSLHDLLAYPFTVSQLISASNQKDDLNNYKVTVINYQQLDLKTEAFREAGNAAISELLDFFSLSGFISGGYSVSFLLTNKPTLTLGNFVTASAPLWDLINNYALNLLIPYFTVAQLVDASNLKDAGVYKVTDTAKQELNLKVGIMKTAGANIKEMMNSFSLSDLIIVGYHVDNLIIASNDTNVPIVTVSNKVTITKFKDVDAPKTEMINAYTLTDLFYYGYSVVDIINTSNLKVNGEFVVIEISKQSLDTNPKILKDALAPTVQMLNYFTLSTLLNTPVSYTVAELKQASASSDVLDANKVTILKFKITFVTIGVALNTYLVSMFGSYSLAELLIEYTVPELAGYDSSITIMNFYNSSADISQMIIHFPLIDLVSANIYSVSTFISNGVTPQLLVDAGMALWKMLNEFNGGIGYLRQANSTTALLSISQLLDAVSNSNTDINKRGLISTSFYLGTGAPFSKPNNVDTTTTSQIEARNYDIFNNSTLIQLLKVTDYSIDYIITTGNNNNVTNLVHKNLNVQSFIDASTSDSFISQNRLSNFIDYFSLSNLVNNWSVSDLKIKGVSGLVSDVKVVTLPRLKVANAPIWDMLSNFTLAQLVNAGYTSTQLVPVSIEKNLDESYKVTQVANRDITLTTIIGAGAPLYDLMNYYTLTQLIDVPYSVSALITESNLKDANNIYMVTVTDYQALDSDAGAVTLKQATALIEQMVNAFLLTQLIKADYRVSVLKTANPDYTKQNFKDAQASLWDILNNYPLIELYNYYSVLELKNTSYDGRITLVENKELTAEKFSQKSAPLWDMLNAYSTLSSLVPYYTTPDLITASQDSRVTVSSNQTLTLVDFKDAGEDLWDLFNSYSLSELLTINFLVADLITSSQDSRVTVTANQNLNISKFKSADTNNNKLWDIVNNYNLGELVNAGYTVDELKGTLNDVRVLLAKTVTLDRLKIANASIPQMLNAYPLDELITAGYTVDELITASADASVTAGNKVTIATFKLANAPKTEMLNAYLLADLISAGYTVADLISASADASVTAGNKVTIAKFKDANAPKTEMLSNYVLSNLVISISFPDGYTTAILVPASSLKNPDNSYKVTQVINRDITLANMISAGAPLYDLMNFYTLSQLISAPVSYSVASLITASNLKDVNNNYKVTVTDYQQLDTKVLTFKSVNAIASQMVGSFTLSVLIGADYRVLTIKNSSSYTITDLKNVSAPLWDMLNVYNITLLINAGYTVAEIKQASTSDSSKITSGYTNLTASNFMSYTTVTNYNNLAVDILNNFTLVQVTNITWRVNDLVTYSNLKDGNNNFMVTVASNNRSLVLNDFKTRSNSPTWDILQYYGLAAMVTGGYTVAELKQTIPFNVSIDSNKRVTIASLKIAEANIRDVINNYTLRELVDNSLTTGGYTLTQLVNASNSIDVPVVTSNNKVTLARLLALSLVPSLEYLLTNYTTFELIKGGITPVALANVRPTIINDIELLGYRLKITTPQLLNAIASNGVVALSINQSFGSDVVIQKYYISYTNDGKTFIPFTVIMDNTQTPSVPQLGNTLYISGLTTNKYYSFRIMASSGTVYSSVSNSIINFFLN